MEWLYKWIIFCLKVGCFCLSEAESGSDAFNMKATARKDGDDYVINANKLWITNSAQADVFLVFANANPELLKTDPKKV